MNDFVPSIQRMVTIQENGIIRNAANGIIIGRLSDDVEFGHLKVQNKLQPKPSIIQSIKNFIKNRG